jgi:hypothetical protein
MATSDRDDDRVAHLEAALRWMILVAENTSIISEDDRKLRLRKAKQMLPFDYPEARPTNPGGRPAGSRNKPKRGESENENGIDSDEPDELDTQ